MKIALFQLNLAWENKKTNYNKVKQLTSKIKNKNVDLVVLPELFPTAYTMNSKKYEEELNGETFQFLSKLAKENKIDILGTFIEKSEKKPKNTAIMINKDGEIISHYSKIHLPKFLEEHKNYSEGNNLALCEINSVKIGITICYDLRFPELFRLLSEQGAKCIFVVANWPKERIQHWDVLLKARALENEVFIAGVNRVGKAPIAEYSGHSVIVDPLGNVIASTKESKEDILIHDIDFSQVDKIRRAFPFQKDKRLKISL